MQKYEKEIPSGEFRLLVSHWVQNKRFVY